MTKRNICLDFLKIICIFLVIIIHVSNRYARLFDKIEYSSYIITCFFNTVSRISVPIFFMVSGALLISKPYTKSSYINRIKKSVITLLIWTIIYYLWEYFYLNDTDINLLQAIFSPFRAHLWFMYALIALYIALPFISKMTMNLTKNEENLFLILWIIFSGGFFVLKMILGGSIEYKIPIISGTYYLGYFISGHILFNRILINREYNKQKNIKLLMIFLISNVIILVVTLIMTKIENTYYKDLFTYTNLFLSLSSLSFFALFLINFNDKNKYVIKLSKISQYSLGIYLLHSLFIDIIKNYIDLKMYHAFYAIPLISLFLFIVSFVIVHILKKIPIVNKYVV